MLHTSPEIDFYEGTGCLYWQLQATVDDSAIEERSRVSHYTYYEGSGSSLAVTFRAIHFKAASLVIKTQHYVKNKSGRTSVITVSCIEGYLSPHIRVAV